MRELMRRLASFFTKGRWEKDCSDEFESHLEMATDENMALGMTPGTSAAAGLDSLWRAGSSQRESS